MYLWYKICHTQSIYFQSWWPQFFKIVFINLLDLCINHFIYKNYLSINPTIINIFKVKYLCHDINLLWSLNFVIVLCTLWVETHLLRWSLTLFNVVSMLICLLGPDGDIKSLQNEKRPSCLYFIKFCKCLRFWVSFQDKSPLNGAYSFIHLHKISSIINF